jgi:virginiamycin B lyase
MTRISIEQCAVADGGPYAITTGPDGALWFTLVRSGQMGRLVPGGAAEYHRLDPACGPTIITPGPDDALWFTEYQAHRIGRVTTGGTLTEFPLPTPECGPSGVAAGPDGALWFTRACRPLERPRQTELDLDIHHSDRR